MECTLVDGGVPAYYIGVKCYEALGGGDCATEGANSERCYVVGGGVGYDWFEEREYWSGGLWASAVRDDGQALRRLQEKDTEFPLYDGKTEHFIPRFVR